MNTKLLKKIVIAAMAIIICASAASCTVLNNERQKASTNAAAAKPEQIKAEASKQVAPKSPDPETLEKYSVDESGEIMIIMYHSLGKEDKGYTRTPKSFRNDLQRLYDAGFLPIPMKDFVSGRIDVPLGKTPYVLTFDDGNISNFRMTDGKIDKDCAVGIIEDFENTHPDFEATATFFLNGGTRFGQKKYEDEKMAFLSKNGYEIGNHSYAHENFKKLGAGELQRTLAVNANELGGAEYLALPFGSRPDKSLLHYLVKGEYNKLKYENKIILNVGWKPSKPSYHVEYDFQSVNRVQCGDEDMQLTYYLKGYEGKKGMRFISDGERDIVSVPLERSESIDKDRTNGSRVITY